MIKRFRRKETLAKHHEGAWYFSSREVGFRYHSAIAYRGMLEQQGLDFRRGNWKSFVLDHLLTAVKHVVKAVGVLPYNVAGKIPAIAKDSRRGLGLLPISKHELRAAHDEFARLARANFISFNIHNAAFGLRQRLPDRCGTIHGGRIAKANVGYGRGFGHAVSLIDHDAREAGKAAREFGGKRRCAAFDPPNFMLLRKDSRFGGVTHSIDGGRDDGHHGDAFVLLNQKGA